MAFSVLMSVYARDDPVFLRQSIDSVLNQTLKPDQVVIVGDGPLTAELQSVIDNVVVNDSSMDFISLPNNIGLGAALNEGITCCKHNLIARMDADDISLPQRFEKQVKFMQSHSDIAVCGGNVDEVDPITLTVLDKRIVPSAHSDIMRMSKYRNPINHMAAIFRKDAIQSVGGYPPLRTSQDYALWSLLLVNGFQFRNLNDTLVLMRTGSDFFARRGLAYLKGEIDLLNYQRAIRFIGLYNYAVNLVSRAIVRLLPCFMKNLLYRYAR